VLGDDDAGIDGDGGCETIVVFANTALRVVEIVVGDTRSAGTEGKEWLLVEFLTVTSK
jgi:hypothetical protein